MTTSCQATAAQGALPKQPGALADLLFLLVLAPVLLQRFCSTIAGGLRGNCLLSDPGSWPGSGDFSGHLSSGVRTGEAENWREGWGRAEEVPGAETRPWAPGCLSAGQTLTPAVRGGQPTGNPFSGWTLRSTWSRPLSHSFWEQHLSFGEPPSMVSPCGVGRG